ncbi:TetR/AcrR family transcriptional regulator [Draconibacterium halophilum]|uniref:TetR/AcrR family transcriptional regulator n=1 Tax=Draconibacterium halophilum TaxID=2706887 RepID=A0A6C0RAH2_9BACT|nr:TetR/AcrR family transcriptional regulator [Draconibacterium halophilum]QIA06962.1 TetR/AcrR family transcriptional regulator [Draconibacterium halophilum]
MARITDQTKIERLKQSTMKMVVDHGFGGASVALISKDAQVASGYFYMHYKGKYELVNTILQEVYSEVFGMFEKLIEQGNPFHETIENIIRHFVELANKEPIRVKFLYVLTNDYNFVIDKHIQENTQMLLEKLMELGRSSNDLDKTLIVSDLYLILIITTIQFINQKYRNNDRDIIAEEDIKHLLKLIFKFLK